MPSLMPDQKFSLITSMSEGDFQKIAKFITTNYGIYWSPIKKSLLESRIEKRVRQLNFSSFRQYLDYALHQSQAKGELITLIDTITTNKTDFFRESAHFDYLKNYILKERSQSFHTDTFRVWSAACSSGEEVYTIAMVMEEHFMEQKKFPYEILGTDISASTISQAQTGIYPLPRLDPIPVEIKKKYFLRGKETQRNLAKVKQGLKENVKFKRLNLIDDDYQLKFKQDIVFCRNVLIYFQRATQEKVINNLCRNIKPGGYLFLGHTDSVFDMKVPLKQVIPSVFQKI